MTITLSVSPYPALVRIILLDKETVVNGSQLHKPGMHGLLL